MTGDQRGAGSRPDFAWIPAKRGLAKLFMSAGQRREAAGGRSLRLLVFPWGVRWIDGGEDVTADWEDVAQVWRSITRHTSGGSPTYTEYRFTLLLADGRSRRFTGTLRSRHARASGAVDLDAAPGVTRQVTIEQAGRLLETGVTRVQLPRAIATLKSGQPVRFGPLTITPAGIAADGQALRWREVGDIRTREEVVLIRKAGKLRAWKKAQVSRIPNYPVFDALVRSVLARRPGG